MQTQAAMDLRTLFWQNVPLRIRKNDRDESCAELNVRVLAGYSAGDALKLLRMYISDGNDPSFLYTLEIAEQHYSRLREDEQLLVDFAGFVDKVAWLMNQCCGLDGVQNEENSSKTQWCKFRAVLQTTGISAGSLKLVESNGFKELSHLNLKLNAGTDASIKQFLAFRLSEINVEMDQVAASLHEMRGIAALQEAQLKNNEDTATAAQQEYLKQSQEYESTISNLAEKLESAQQTIASLTERLQRAESQLSATEQRANAAEMQVSQLQQIKSELDVELSERLVQLQETTARAEAAEVAASQVAQRCQGFEAALKQAELRIDEWKAIASTHESNVASSTSELALARERAAAAEHASATCLQQLQDRNEQLSGFDKIKIELRSKVEALEKREIEYQQKLQLLETSAAAVQSAAGAAAAELEEAKKKIDSNDKMISWLNKQLTAAQLQAGSLSSSIQQQVAGGAPMPTTPGKSWPSSSPSPASSSMKGWPQPRPALNPRRILSSSSSSSAGGHASIASLS